MKLKVIEHVRSKNQTERKAAATRDDEHENGLVPRTSEEIRAEFPRATR